MYPIIDLHQDVWLNEYRSDRVLGTQTSFSLLERANVRIVHATAFPKSFDAPDYLVRAREEISADLDRYVRTAEDRARWRIIRTADNVRQVLACDGCRGILLHVEGLDFFGPHDWELLDRWYARGLRSVGIAYGKNALGSGNAHPDGGLTDLGREVLAWLADRRVLIDCAHMNERTFWDTAQLSLAPLYISHGNACAVCPTNRNYTDDQLRAVAASGGLVGLMLGRLAVSGEREPAAELVAAHARHIKRLIGTRHLGIGSDFGGIMSGLVPGLETVDRLPALFDILRNAGFSEDEVADVAYRNARRFLLERLP